MASRYISYTVSADVASLLCFSFTVPPFVCECCSRCSCVPSTLLQQKPPLHWFSSFSVASKSIVNNVTLTVASRGRRAEQIVPGAADSPRSKFRRRALAVTDDEKYVFLLFPRKEMSTRTKANQQTRNKIK